MMTQTRTTWMLATLSAVAAASGQDPDALPYPYGKQFVLGLYSVPVDHLAEVKAAGWNVVHTYGFKPEFLTAVGQAGLVSLAPLPRRGEQVDEAAIKQRIVELAASDALCWWDIPEELRYWRADEWAMVRDYPTWTRELDPRRRPVMMYFPNHYDAAALARYVPHLDLITAGCYTDATGQPRAWVRWRVEQQVQAIRLAGHEIGPDYLNGQRTVVSALGLYYPKNSATITSGVAAYHDFWSAICSGAQGILLFSYWHKRDDPFLEQAWTDYCRAAAQIRGEEHLGEVVLYGTVEPKVSARVVSGPPLGDVLQTAGQAAELRYPSVNVRAWRWNDQLYLVAVNSNRRGVTAEIAGLPDGLTEGEALFEQTKDAAPRRLAVAGGTLTDAFDGYGVHLYKLPLPKP